MIDNIKFYAATGWLKFVHPLVRFNIRVALWLVKERAFRASLNG